MSDPNKTEYPQQRGWGVFEPLMDPTNPDLYKMLASVFDEIVALFLMNIFTLVVMNLTINNG